MQKPIVVSCMSSQFDSVLRYVAEQQGTVFPILADSFADPVFAEICERNEVQVVSYEEFASSASLVAISLDELTEQSKRIESSDIVVAFTDDSDLLRIAVLFAILHHRSLQVLPNPSAQELIAYLQQVGSEGKTLTVFGLPDDLPADRLRVLMENSGHVDTGIMTSWNLNFLSKLVVKPFLDRGPSCGHLFVEPIEDRPIAVPHAHTKVIARNDAVVESLAPEPGSIWESATFYGHGTDDVMYIGGDMLCGVAPLSLQDTESDETVLPICRFSGECFKEGKLMTAADLKVRTMFANTCVGLKVSDSRFVNGYSIGLNILRGYGQAFVGSNRIKDGYLFESLLFYYLTQGGVTLGRAVRLVNEALVNSGMESACYYLIGDPNMKIAEGTIRPTVYQWEASDDNQWLLHTEPLQDAYVSLELSDPKLYHQALENRLCVELFPLKSFPVYYSYTFDHERQTVTLHLLSTNTWITEKQTRIQLSTVSVVPDEFRRALTGIWENFETNQILQVIPQKLKGKIAELKTSMTNLARLAVLSKYELTSVVKSKSTVRKLEQMLLETQKGMLQELLDVCEKQTFLFTDYYITSFDIDNTRHDKVVPCPYCQRPSMEREVTHALIRSFTRTYYMCPTCGNYLDRPTRASLEMSVTGADVIHGEQATQTIHLHNTSDVLLQGVVGLRVHKYATLIEPGMVEFSLQPGESLEIPCSIRGLENIPPHAHFVKALAFCNMEFYLAAKQFVIQWNPNQRLRGAEPHEQLIVL